MLSRRALATFGWPGMFGLLLLFGAGVMYLTVVQDSVARLAQLKSDSASLKSQIDLAARTGIPETGSMEELKKFYGFFSGVTLTEWLNKLYGAAKTQNLLLEQGEYRLSQDKSDKLARYQITLPVKGTYLQIRQFVDQALIDVPVAALDDINFKREVIGGTQLEARIKFTLYVGAN